MSNSRMKILLIIPLLCMIVKAENNTCPTNEVMGCKQPPGCSTCSNPIYCATFRCDRGCECRSGYYRNSNGNCVSERECNTTKDSGNNVCTENEEVVPCSKPKWCNTCEIRGNCKLARCTSGCDCIPGYYRDSRGICIPATQCGSSCPENEIYRCKEPEGCLTCENRFSCPTFVCDPGCVCKENHYRNKNGACVPEEKCEGCPVNEETSDCPTECNSCKYIKNPCPFREMCVKGCACKQGYARLENRTCVLKEECPTNGKLSDVCGINEVFSECGSACPTTCDGMGRNVMCIMMCIPGCVCKEGFIRTSNQGACVRFSECPQNARCKSDEEYYDCIPGCTNTCETYGIRDRILCPAVCNSGCFCKQGLVKRKDGKCVRFEQC